MHLGEVPPLTHDLNRLLRRLEVHEVETDNLQSLGQLTLYAVQVRYDADPQPLGLDRAVYNAMVRELLEQVEETLRNGAA